MSSSDKPRYRESDDTREIPEGENRTEKPSQRDVDKGADSIIENKGKWYSGSDRGPDFIKADERQQRESDKQPSPKEAESGKWSTGSDKGPDFNKAYERDLEESDKD